MNIRSNAQNKLREEWFDLEVQTTTFKEWVLNEIETHKEEFLCWLFQLSKKEWSECGGKLSDEMMEEYKFFVDSL
jgi:uncharacterized protein with NRDE domain